jgi:glycosyltransferase involved in cell wall biosynthesis
MKILLGKGSFFSQPNGADEQLVNYAVHLQKAGHAITVVILCRFPKSDLYYQQLRQAGVRVVCLGRHPLYLFFLCIRAILQWSPCLRVCQWLTDWETLLHYTCVYYLRRNRPDVLHVLVEGGVFLKAAHVARVPVIYQEIATPWRSKPWECYYRRLETVLGYATGLAALSPRHAMLCGDLLAWKGEVDVIPLIIPDPLQIGFSVRRRGGAPVLGFAGRIERLKGVFLLIQAFAIVIKKVPEAKLNLAGSGEDEKQVAAEAELLGICDRCEFLGPYEGQGAMSEFMSRLDVLVHPSLTEGTPHTIGEAMAHGLPIIASDVGGIPDMLTEESGILIPVGEVQALAEAMLRVINDRDLCARMGLASRSRYETVFSPQAVIPLILGAYDRVQREYHGIGAEDWAAASAHPWKNAVAHCPMQVDSVNAPL